LGTDFINPPVDFETIAGKSYRVMNKVATVLIGASCRRVLVFELLIHLSDTNKLEIGEYFHITKGDSMKTLGLKRILRLIMVVVFALPLPDVGYAAAIKNSEPKMEMISTADVLNDLTRAETENEVREFFQKEDVQALLLKQGISQDEVSKRLASLSQEEMNKLSSQVKEARAGGDILVTVLVIVLIIFLIKRI
jgi:hypothetical protein